VRWAARGLERRHHLGATRLRSVGLPNLVTMWDKTRGATEVRGFSGNNAMRCCW